MNIGEQLKAARTRQHLTLKDVSKKTNLSISYISDIEHGKSQPPLDTLTSLCKALNLSVYTLFKEREEDLMLREGQHKEALDTLLKDFSLWPLKDQEELLYYLEAKKIIRSHQK